MAASHLCIDCGLDLVRERTVLEPHYGLPLVTCPRCDSIAVRRRHPLIAQWHTTRRLVAALAVIVIQLGLLTLCFPLVWAICLNVSTQYRRTGLSISDEADAFAVAVLFGVVPVALGTWLTAGFAHWPRWWASRLVFGGLVACALSTDAIIVPALSRWLVAAGLDVPVSRPDLELYAVRLMILAVMLLVSCFGVPIGQLIRTTIIRAGRRRRSLYRRRVRRERPA